jgi:hypothetical protein
MANEWWKTITCMAASTMHWLASTDSHCDSDLPETRRSELARQTKKNKWFPLSCPKAARQHHLAKQHSGNIGPTVLCDSAYIRPVASLDVAPLAWGNQSCYYPLTRFKPMGGGAGDWMWIIFGGWRRSIRATSCTEHILYIISYMISHVIAYITYDIIYDIINR